MKTLISALLFAMLFAGPAMAQDSADLSEDDLSLSEEDLSLSEEDLSDEESPKENAAQEDRPPDLKAPRAKPKKKKELRLSDDDLRLNDVVVTFTQKDIFHSGGSITRIDKDQLDTFSYDDPHDVLPQATGVYVRSEDGFGLRPNIGLRGGNPERSKKVTLMEDGVLFGPAPFSAPAAYYFPLISRMVNVDVFKGPGALLYGPQTIGGAIDLRTRAVPDKSSGRVALSYGFYGNRKAHAYWGTSNENAGILMEIANVGSMGFKQVDGTDDDTGFNRLDGMLRAFVQTDVDAKIYHRLGLKLGVGFERSNETYLGLTDADFRAQPQRRYAATQLDRMKWFRTQLALSWRVDLGEHLSAVTTLYRHDFDRSWFRLNRFRNGPSLSAIVANPTGRRAVFYDILRGEGQSTGTDDTLMMVNNQRRYFSHGIQSVVRGDAQTGKFLHDIEVGLRFHQDQVRREHIETGYLMQSSGVPGAAATMVRDGSEELPVTLNVGHASALAAHVVYGLRFELGPGELMLKPGLRFSWVRGTLTDELAGTAAIVNETTTLLPGASVQYTLGERLKVGILGGVYRGSSPLAPGQSDEIKPEFSVNYELGVRMEHKKEAFQAEAIGFLNDYSNLGGQCSFSTGCSVEMLDTQFNAGEVLVWGAEVAASKTFHVGKVDIPLRLSYTYTGSSFGSSFDSDDPTFGQVMEGDELPYIPKHQGQLQAGVSSKKLGLRVSIAYNGRMREEAGSEDETPFTDDYVGVNLAAYYQITQRGRVTLRINNLLNRQPIVSRRPFGARSIQPFGAQLGIRWDL